MSDAEDDYGDYEEPEDVGDLDEDAAAAPVATAAVADAADAADDADDADDDVDDDADDADDADDDAAGAAAAAAGRPEDPLLRTSNRPRYIHVVLPEERVTDSRIHRTEVAHVIAMRAQQIAKHATHFAGATDLHDPVALAYRELFERRCPLILRRTVGAAPNGDLIVEEWAVREMTLPPLTPPVALGTAAAPTAAR